ncbi:hypothetical protein PG994_011037 [Apiospora phragmitis]|uniref:Uncharacterized protein n=1 Tax=Apiospora phragmitis TaxID=2905665 RepID=A0ABR1TRT0_9PEZI
MYSGGYQTSVASDASIAEEGEPRFPLSDVKDAAKQAPLPITHLAGSGASTARASATATSTKQSAAVPLHTAPSEPHKETVSDRPLISYAYAESESGRANFKYFLEQGLHGAADFIFIINGETDAADLIPHKPNIRIVRRNNTCFDLGAHGEVLRENDLWKKHKRFITLNASIRGPFLPRWSRGCWSDVYLGRVTEKVKLVGMTVNCGPQYHIQSMIFATDRVGMELMLYPPPGSSRQDEYGDENDMVALQGCYTEMRKAIHGEVGTTGLIRNAGYEVEALMSAFAKSRRNYAEECAEHPVADVLYDHQYYGSNLHPYETIFIKANRDIDPVLINDLSDWHMNGAFPNSWDMCG